MKELIKVYSKPTEDMDFSADKKSLILILNLQPDSVVIHPNPNLQGCFDEKDAHGEGRILEIDEDRKLLLRPGQDPVPFDGNFFVTVKSIGEDERGRYCEFVLSDYVEELKRKFREVKARKIPAPQTVGPLREKTIDELEILKALNTRGCNQIEGEVGNVMELINERLTLLARFNNI